MFKKNYKIFNRLKTSLFLFFFRPISYNIKQGKHQRPEKQGNLHYYKRKTKQERNQKLLKLILKQTQLKVRILLFVSYYFICSITNYSINLFFFQIINQSFIFLKIKTQTLGTIFNPKQYQQMASQKNQTALQKMQQIANRLISNTPQLVKMLDSDSLLKPKRQFSPNSNKKNPSSNKVNSQNNNPSQLLNYNKSQMTANDYHQKCKQLTNQLLTQRDKNQQLQDQITIIKQRFVQRQIQYRKIIQELQQQIKSKSVLDVNDKNRMQTINQLHKEIITNISSIQSKTSKILIEQESDIRRFFHKKINEIKEKFKQDKINKSQKDQEYHMKQKQMMSELEWIKNIAHKIDSQNQLMVKKYGNLKSQFEIQQKDKEILLKQLLMKKKQNAVLKAQVQQYQKLLNQVSKQMEQQQLQEKSFYSNQQMLPNIKSPNNNNMSNSNMNIKKSSVNNLLNQSRTSQTQNNKQSRFGAVKQSRMSNMASKGQLVVNVQANSSNNQQKSTYQNTIAHLKNIIFKQKKKVRELKNLYMREIGNKSQLQKIIRKLVDDVRQSIVEVEKQRKKKRNNFGQEDQLNQQNREQILQKLLSNQKILTLIYDKTFYANQGNNKNFNGNSNNFTRLVQEIPEEIQHILQDDQAQGFQ